jgi:hypothetical protein
MASDKHETSDKHDDQERQRAARTAQQDHTPRQEEQYAREHGRSSGTAKTTAPAPDPKAAAELKEAQAAGSIGAQIILDFNDDTSKGARGGAGGTVEENTMARDAGLVGLGLDPVNCSGPPPSQAQLAARRQREEEQAKLTADPQFYPPPSGHATKMSSLAAGIDEGDVPPPTVRGGAAA